MIKCSLSGITINDGEEIYFKEVPLCCTIEPKMYWDEYKKLRLILSDYDLELIEKITRWWRYRHLFSFHITDIYNHILTIRANQKGISGTYVDFIEDKTILTIQTN